MGNDGGSIPTRRELVKEAVRNPTTTEIKASQHEQQEYYWTTDPISRKPLQQPVVSDSSGKLYNKDTILEYLVEGNRKADADVITQGAIAGLRDIVEVKFEVDAEASTKERGVWKCPVTGDRLGPGSKAVYLVPCGHAFSGSAIKEVSGEKCLSCNEEYASNDIIPILSTVETDIARLSLRVKTLKEKGLTHSLKKAPGGGKKRKHKNEIAQAALEPTVQTSGINSKAATPSRTSTPVNGQREANSAAGIKNVSTASLTAKVLQEQEKAKKRKLENANVASLFSSRDQSKPSGRNSDFMTRGYEIPAGAKR